MILIAIFGIIIFLSIYSCISTYNELIKRRNKVRNSLAHIEAQLQKRFDLIPNLVEVVKKYAEYEQDSLGNVSSVRDNYLNASSNAQKLAMDLKLNSELKSLYVVIEQYPNLKTNEQFLKLQEALTEIEEDITYARQFYNDAVTIYNNKLMSFPGNFIAAQFDFKEEALFDAVSGAESSPLINLSINKKCKVCGAPISSSNKSCPYCNSAY